MVKMSKTRKGINLNVIVPEIDDNICLRLSFFRCKNENAVSNRLLSLPRTKSGDMEELR